MTNEEAIKWLDEHLIGNIEVKALATKALDKQTPKKPIVGYLSDYACGSCYNKILSNDKYCGNCGQEIDWRK